MSVIKRYPNRKLYDTDAKHYVTLEDIANLIREGEEVQVIDHKSGEDLTAVTLTQIILELERRQGGFLPKSVLTTLVRAGGDTFQTLRRGLTNPLELWRQVDAEIERRMQALISRGELAREEGLKLRDKLLSQSLKLPNTSLPGEQGLERLLKVSGVPQRSEIAELNQQLEDISARLDALLQEAEAEE